jgi:hypothetical protein
LSVSVCVCVCVCTSMHTYIHIYIYTNIYIYIYIYVYTHTPLNRHIHTHTCTRVQTQMHTFIRTFICTHKCSYTCVHTCAHECMSINILRVCKTYSFALCAYVHVLLCACSCLYRTLENIYATPYRITHKCDTIVCITEQMHNSMTLGGMQISLGASVCAVAGRPYAPTSCQVSVTSQVLLLVCRVTSLSLLLTPVLHHQLILDASAASRATITTQLHDRVWHACFLRRACNVAIAGRRIA